MQLRLHEDVSVMRAELTAITEASSYASTVGEQKIVILSDSKSALQHLARCVSGIRGMPIAYDALGLLHRLQNRNVCVEFQWIPSHIGIPENEVVDQLAGNASDYGVDDLNWPYGSEIIPYAKALCKGKWEKAFKESSQTKGAWYYTMQDAPGSVPWFEYASLSRESLVVALRLRAGHVPLNGFYFLMGVRSSPFCDLCHKPEDIVHVLLECDRYCDLRLKLLSNIDLFNGGINATLGRPLSKECMSIYNFLKLCMKERNER